MNYIGSKLSLLDFINDVIETKVEKKDNLVFCDIFSGTAIVGQYFKNKGYSIISNDIQYFSYVLAKVLVENNNELTFDKLKEININNPFDYLNKLKGRKGFIYHNYCLEGTQDKEFQRIYFSNENAKRIDAMRMKISSWNKKGLLQEKEYYYLIASLVEASDKVADTASVYEAFLKTVKLSATKEIKIEPLKLNVVDKKASYFACNEDASYLINHISGDVLYLDPPYNSRKYDTNYHILETIALYDHPHIKGKTGVRTEEIKKSKFCSKKEASSALEDIVSKAKFDYILLSYNDEGIISLEEIKNIFSKYGEYSCYEKKHRRFKADSKRNYTKDYTIEYIHCLKKHN